MDPLPNLVWLLLFLFPLPLSLCDQLLRFGLNGGTVDPCVDECKCYNWETINTVGDREKRFTVNCTGMKFGLFQGLNIPKNLPFNTTDLVVSEYLLGTLSLASFPNQDFPLNPMLLGVSLEACHITYLSSGTFQGNSFVSIRNISLSHNSIELLLEGTFWHLPYVENISIDSNFLQKVQTAAFRNLPQVHVINLSHNAISEIQLGAFDNLPLLETLDLSYNWLTAIPGEDISQLPSLKILSLKGNFWNCSCEMSWILKLNHSVLVESQAMCQYPLALNGTALWQLTMHDFQNCFTSGIVHSYVYNVVALLSSFVVLCASLLYLVYMRLYSNQSNLKVIGQIEFDSRNVLGPNVFKGKLQDGRFAAIKRLPQLSNRSSNELHILLHVSEKGPPHPNVIQYLWVEKDSITTYIALELCGGNLKNAISNREEEILPYLTPECCLLQITRGLNYLHNLKVQHRDIKPHNILWKYSGFNSDELRFIVSDFDLGHFSADQSSHRSMYGTLGWTAPELWNKGERTTAVDIFSLGCVFYYVLTIGGHPFGSMADMEICQQNIDENKLSLNGLPNEHCAGFVAALAEDLIREMIHLNGFERPGACDILEHPLFWDNDEKTKFFHRIGNYMEDKKSLSANRLRDKLEHDAAIVFQGSWMERLHKTVRNDVKGFKEQRTKLCGLLRVVRNKMEHFEKLGEELKAIYLGSPEGVVQYYNGHFPKLLICTYRIEQEWARGQ